MRLNLFFIWNFFLLYCYFNNVDSVPTLNNYLIFITSNSVFYFNFLFFYFIFLFYFYLYFFNKKFYFYFISFFIVGVFFLWVPAFSSFYNVNLLGGIFQKNYNGQLTSIFFDFTGPGLFHGISFLICSSFTLFMGFCFFFKQNSLANFVLKYKWFSLLQFFIFFFLSLYVLISGAYWAFFSEIWANWYNNDIIEVFYIFYFFFCMFFLHNLTKRYFLFNFAVYLVIVIVIFLTALRLGLLTSKHTSFLFLKKHTNIDAYRFTHVYLLFYLSKSIHFKSVHCILVNLLFTSVVPTNYRFLVIIKKNLNLVFWIFSMFNFSVLFIFLIIYSNTTNYMLLFFVLFLNFLVYGLFLFILFLFFNNKFLQTLKKTQNQIHLLLLCVANYLFYFLWSFFSIRTTNCGFSHNTLFLSNYFSHFSQYFLKINSYPYFNQLAYTQTGNINLDKLVDVAGLSKFSNLNNSFTRRPDSFQNLFNLSEKQVIKTIINSDLNFTYINYKNYFEFTHFTFFKIEYDFIYSQISLLVCLFVFFLL